jgi:hypothetical protein
MGCWVGLLTFFGLWRVVRGIFGLFLYIVTLVPLILLQLFQFCSRRGLEVYRPYDPAFDSLIGLVCIISAWSIGVGFFANSIGSPILSVLGIVILIVLLLGHFHPVAWFRPARVKLLKENTLRVYDIRVSKQTEWSTRQAVFLMQQVLDASPEIIFQIEADPAGIHWKLIDVRGQLQAEVLEAIIYAHYPQCAVQQIPYSGWHYNANIQQSLLVYELEEIFPLSLQTRTSLQHGDTIATLSSLVNDLESGERVSFVVAVGGQSHVAQRVGRRQATRSGITLWNFLTRQGVNEAFRIILNQEDHSKYHERYDGRLIEEKLRSQSYFAVTWIQVQTMGNQRSQILTQMMDSYLQSLSQRPHNRLKLHSRLSGASGELLPNILSVYESWRRGKSFRPLPSLVLTVEELASLWHLPHDAVVAARIQRVQDVLPISEELSLNQSGTKLGKGYYHRHWIDVFIKIEDRKQHMLISGQTGTGKSTITYKMIADDIRNGRGVAVIDPHNSLVRHILQTCDFAGRENDVVLIDVADENYPVPLNPLALRRSREDVFTIIGIIERLFAGTDQAVQTSAFMRAGLLLISEEPQITIKDLAYVFLDDEYRYRLLEKTQDTDVLLYLTKQFNQASSQQRATINNPILNRVRPFYANPYLYPMVCHPDCLDFKKLINEKKIILITLDTDSRRVPPQERHLLGTLLMTQLQIYGMDEQRSEPYFIYVDEAQHFVTTSLDTMFSEARKYGLSLTLANQYLGQLMGNTKDAVLGNVGATISFRSAYDDVSILAARTKPEANERHLLNLDNHVAVVKTLSSNGVQPAFTVYPEPLPALPDDAQARLQRIRELSRQKYSPKSREEVLAWLSRRYDRQDDYEE